MIHFPDDLSFSLLDICFIVSVVWLLISYVHISVFVKCDHPGENNMMFVPVKQSYQMWINPPKLKTVPNNNETGSQEC